MYVVVVGLRRNPQAERDRGDPCQALADIISRPAVCRQVGGDARSQVLSFMPRALSLTGRAVCGSSISSRFAERVPSSGPRPFSPASETALRQTRDPRNPALVHRKNTNSSPWFSTGEPEKLCCSPLTVPPGVITSTELRFSPLNCSLT